MRLGRMSVSGRAMQAVVVLQDRRQAYGNTIKCYWVLFVKCPVIVDESHETFDRVLIGFDMAKLIRRIS